MSLTRAIILALALVVCAWYAVGIRQARDTTQAAAIVARGSDASSKQVAHAASLLRSAGALNPDSQVDILRGKVALIRHHHSQAATIFENLVHREPQNLQAWVLVALASRNVPEFKRAAARIVELDPSLRRN